MKEAMATVRGSMAPLSGRTRQSGVARYPLPGGHSTDGLTLREREVLAALVQFGRPPEAARALHISPHTLKIHLTRIYDKLGVSNRTGAIVEAIRRGELSL